MIKEPDALELADILRNKIPSLDCLELAAEELLRLHGISKKYHELLYAVHEAFPDESRHQTALRYITQTERLSMMCESAKEQT